MHDEPIKPGYKRTEVGVIPVDWELKRIGDITSSTAGGTPSTKVGIYWGGDIKWMSSGELHLKRVYDVEGRITEVGLKNSSAKLVPPRCVLVGLAGQGKTRGTVAINMVPLSTNQSVAAILPSNCFVPEYLYFNLDSRYEELRSLSTGASGRGGLNLTILNSLMIPFPPLSEQRAIAEVLSDVDALLDALERLIAKKRAIKQGAMQALLTGRVRLPGFSEKWQTKRIGDMLDYERPDKYIVQSTDYVDVGTPVLTANKSFVLGYTDEEVGIYTDLPVIVFDDFTTDSKYADFPFKVKSSAIKLLKPSSNHTNLKFIFERMKLINFSLRDHKRYYISEYRNIEISVPKIREQTAIAEVLSDMDAEIEALEKRRAKLRDIKQGMMQELLTGRIRLVPPQERAEEANV